MKRRNLIVTLTLSALFCTLICIGSFIRIPMPNMMPVTLQTFFVLMTGLVLPIKASSLAILTYIALGLIGLPIFSGGGGIGYVLMPNFGFIIGFLIATVIISVITNKMNNRNLWHYIVVSLFGIVAIYIIGILYFAFITNQIVSLKISIFDISFFADFQIVLSFPNSISYTMHNSTIGYSSPQFFNQFEHFLSPFYVYLRI